MNKEKILLPVDPSGGNVPWLWIGTWSMGGEGFGGHDERESLKVLDAAVANGIRHFDTSGFYGHGKSEELLQKVVRSDREEFFISTKGGLVWDGRRVEHRASSKELEYQLAGSMERLKTDYIDLYQLHWPDPGVPLHESIGALKVLQAKGLIRYWGVGNLTEKQIRDTLSDEKNIPHQVHFNPINHNESVLDEGKDRCINCIVSPLEQGLLGIGTSSRGKGGIGKKDIRNRNPYFSDPKVLQWNEKLADLSKEHSLSKVTAVLLWICSQPHVHAIIPGPRKRTQLKEILQFRTAIEDHGLLNAGKSGALLAVKKVKKLVYDELWECLSNRPVMGR